MSTEIATQTTTERPDEVTPISLETAVTDANKSAPKPEKKKKGKPDFREFLGLLSDALSAPDSKSHVASIKKIIQTGYVGTFGLPQVEEVFEVLRDRTDLSVVAVHLAIFNQCPPVPQLCRHLLIRLLAHFRLQLNFPPDIALLNSSREQSTMLIEWLNRHIAPDPGKPASSHPVSLSLDKIRGLALILMQESVAVRTGALYQLLDYCAKPGTAYTSGEADLQFLRELEKQLCCQKPAVQNLGARLGLAAPARLLVGHFQEQLVDISEKHLIQADRLQQLETANATLNESLQHETQRVRDLEQEFQQKTLEIAREKEERGIDQEHFDSQLKLKLSKQAHEFTSRISHEIREATFCLTDGEPNIEMAVNRLNQIATWLQQKAP